jgi:predicted transposase/invertase (TIGR01784 family)
MFDNICKYLAEQFSSDFARWLLGESMALTQLSPSELSLEPMRADALILLQSDALVLHLEFQTQPSATIPFRMADYCLRIYRRFPDKQQRQVVLYLCQTGSPWVYQQEFRVAGLHHRFEVIRLWEQPSQVFLQYPGLLPFAVLGQSEDRVATLRQVAGAVEQLGEGQQQQDVAASSAVLAGLVLEKQMIQRILRREIMRESVIYQEWRAEAMAEGRAEGRAEGQQIEAANLVVRLLTRRLGQALPSEVSATITALPLLVLEELGEALLEFSTLDQLQDWLAENQSGETVL